MFVSKTNPWFQAKIFKSAIDNCSFLNYNDIVRN